MSAQDQQQLNNFNDLIVQSTSQNKQQRDESTKTLESLVLDQNTTPVIL
jgi:hypothetical protein